MKTIRPLTLADLNITVIATDEIDIDIFESLGECMSRDDIAELLEEAQNSNVWKWCAVEVKGDYKGIVIASDYLGGCSYASEEDFKSNGYYEQMRDTVLQEIQEQVNELIKELTI